MDPDETLRLLRLTIKQMQSEGHRDFAEVFIAHAEEVIEYFEALDEWLTKGGFYPQDWANDGDNAGRI